jgi:DNA-binding FrmR family transcriptional regulator
MQHASHPNIIRRLKQVRGQIDSILGMFAEGRSCTDLAQQLQSVESVIHTAKRTLIQDHMEHCIGDMGAEQAMREFKALAKYL